MIILGTGLEGLMQSCIVYDLPKPLQKLRTKKFEKPMQAIEQYKQELNNTRDETESNVIELRNQLKAYVEIIKEYQNLIQTIIR